MKLLDIFVRAIMFLAGADLKNYFWLEVITGMFDKFLKGFGA